MKGKALLTTSTGRRGYVGVDRRWLADPALSDSALRLMLWLDSHSDEYLRDLNVKRITAEIGWSRNRVKRTLDDLVDLGLISIELVMHTDKVNQRTLVTLHQDAWSDGGPRRTPLGVHDEPREGVHGEAPTTSTPIVETNSQEPPNPPKGGGAVERTIPFEDWYDQWPKKQGRQGAERKWKRLTLKEQEMAMTQLPLWVEYARLHPEGNLYVPMASTYVNGKRWLDDMPRIPQAATRVERTRNAATRFLERHEPQSNPRRELT